MKTFPSPEALRRFPFGLAATAFSRLMKYKKWGAGALIGFLALHEGCAPTPPVPDVSEKRCIAFIALTFSVLFTFLYGYVAANIQRAEKVILNCLNMMPVNRGFTYLS